MSLGLIKMIDVSTLYDYLWLIRYIFCLDDLLIKSMSFCDLS